MAMRILLLLLLGGLVIAKDHGKKHWKDDEKHLRTYGAFYFRGDDIRIIYDHYRPRQLPPGLQKKLYRTGQLPPGWEKKIRPFPVVIERRLPPLCGGCERGYLDGYAIVYQPRSRVIIDVHAVFTP
jgi:hypothetical protein